MSKALIAESIAKAAPQLTKAQCWSVAGAVLEGVTRHIVKGGGFAFPGVGTVSVVRRAARNGFNPRTKQPIKIAARKVLRFKPSSKIDAQLNKPPKAARKPADGVGAKA